MSSHELQEKMRLYQVRCTVVDMLSDRGYLVPERGTLSREEFMERHRDNDPKAVREALTLLVQQRNDPTDKIFVFFPEDQKVGVKPIRKFCERMKDESVGRAIIVVQQNPTPYAKQALQEMSGKLVLETFQETELLVNITQHVLVPQHVVLNDDEKKALLQKYKLQENLLPRIQVQDPVARYYGLQRGQVVKIIRPSETAGRYLTYRWVV
eukprot:CAMPEP_0177644190 /NCGR_PEP_ID=MMETSP0447-20121125/8550_1 /TAXON_ID=0 /ORGANISM="Stygamoeba regulata, Strain BSH-02190019" /LENGTH=209 /DNA_ID=CAMNT_0019146523 /DNA_START=50 /DNA_END=679 /DNA_ORIENTATION=-